jgi:hypothetical protein
VPAMGMMASWLGVMRRVLGQQGHSRLASHHARATPGRQADFARRASGDG